MDGIFGVLNGRWRHGGFREAGGEAALVRAMIEGIKVYMSDGKRFLVGVGKDKRRVRAGYVTV